MASTPASCEKTCHISTVRNVCPGPKARRDKPGREGTHTQHNAAYYRIELAMNIARYMMFFVFGMLLGLLLSALLPSLTLWLLG
jgi:hypothetical protein